MKRNIRIASCILLVLALAGCSRIHAYQKSMYDDNAKIASQGDSYTFRDRIGSVKENILSLTFSGFYGKQSIWRVDAEEDGSVDADIKITMKSGKFKLCLIDNENKVSVITEGVGINKLSVPIKKGRNYLVIVGNNAAGEVRASLQATDGIVVQAVPME